ncbi:hypothetical protein BT69DRAFT_678189 [Atractiella rhizophila]|nr:hypothetical protein BT69DRAFT_678189 [Atractiella rhizophila]
MVNFSFLPVVAIFLASAQAATKNLIKDPGFELRDGSWKLSGGGTITVIDGDVDNGYWFSSYYKANATSPSYAKQTVSGLKAGTKYTLTFSLGVQNPDLPPEEEDERTPISDIKPKAKVNFGTFSADLSKTLDYGLGGYTFTFAAAKSEMLLQFKTWTEGVGFNINIDDVKLVKK